MNWAVAGKWFVGLMAFMAWAGGFSYLLKELDSPLWLSVYLCATLAVCMGWVSAQLGEEGMVRRHGSNHQPPVRMPPPPPNPPPRNP